MIFCSNEQIFLSQNFRKLERVIFVFNCLDVIFNSIVERRAEDGSIVHSFKKSFFMYMKGWMLVDLMCIAGFMKSIQERNVFDAFRYNVTHNRIDGEMS